MYKHIAILWDLNPGTGPGSGGGSDDHYAIPQGLSTEVLSLIGDILKIDSRHFDSRHFDSQHFDSQHFDSRHFDS
jgi:hypothetical protein